MMLTKATAIAWAILMGMAPHKTDTETRAEREVRMGQVAAAIAIASDGDRERAIYLLVQIENETHAAERIQRHECKAWECDPVRTKRKGNWVREFLAVGPWQVHKGYQAKHRALWAAAWGDGFAGLVAGARLADSYRMTCGGDLVAQYTANDGRGCVEKGGWHRASKSGDKRARRHIELRAKWGAELWKLNHASD